MKVMRTLRSLSLGLHVLLIVTCSERKDQNPLTENNEPPTLVVIGFEADSLVFVSERNYPFQFIATDESTNDPQVSAKSVGNTGTVTIIDKTNEGLHRANYMPFTKGEHLIEISVSDGLENTSGTLTVFFGDNRAPVAVIQFRAISRDIDNQRFTYEFDGSQSHDNDSELVNARWNLDGAILDTQPNETFEHTFTYYANYAIELTVEDEFGDKNTASLTIDNSRPAATFAIRPDDEGHNGDQITLDATASNSPHGDIVEYRWYARHASRGLDLLTISAANLFRYDVNLPVGNNAIGLVVEDAGGNVSDTTWATFAVINSPPQVDYTFTTELERVTITTNPTLDIDPGDTFTYSWSIADSLLASIENQRLPSFSIRGAVYQLNLTATDNHGGAGSVTKSVSVPGVPEAHFVFPNGVEDNFEAQNGQAIVIDGSGSTGGNESRGIDTYTWMLRTDQSVQTLSEGRSSSVVFNVNHTIGDYEIGLRVRNSEGLESVITWRVLEVVNSAPNAEFDCEFQAFPQALVYRITDNTSSDPDPEDSIRFRWLLDGVVQSDTTATPTFTRGHSDFVNTITLRVLDAFGGVGEKSVDGGCQD